MKQQTNTNGKNLIGERLKSLRGAKKLSQRDLARVGFESCALEQISGS